MTKKSNINQSIDVFLKTQGITSGGHKIVNSIIYYEYKVRWSSPLTKASRIGFFRYMNKHFKSWRFGNKRGYYLNNVFDLSRDNQMKARIFTMMYNLRKNNDK